MHFVVVDTHWFVKISRHLYCYRLLSSLKRTNTFVKFDDEEQRTRNSLSRPDKLRHIDFCSLM